jgi:diguanylate cyclase (GGDEF)-like protein/PAS domain S-box-containing protein
MIDEPLRVSDDWLKNWRASIAVKITAAVLYGVVIVGFTVSIFSLRNLDDKLKSEYQTRADQFTYQVEVEIARAAAVSPAVADSVVRQLFLESQFLAVAATVDGQHVLVGNLPGKAFTLVRTAHVHGQELRNEQRAVTLEIYLPPIADAAKARRNKLLFAMGLATLVFGFFLTWVIRKFIAKPFHTLVNATKTVSAGDLTYRLDDRREDEFGYLARFFNQMLDQIVKELTERQQAEDAVRASEQEMKRILDSIHAGVVVIDPEAHVIVDANDAAIKMIGAPKERVVGRVCHQFICPTEIGKCPISDLHTTIDNSERALLTVEGGRIPILKSVVPVILKGRKHFIESFIDISNLKQAQEQITRMAYFDSLTNLPNRLLFRDRLQLAINYAERHRSLFALLILDLDNFKRINDTLGHRVGDLLLKEAAQRLTDSMRSTDAIVRQSTDEFDTTVARQGGDEFTILLTEINHVQHAAKVSQRFLEALAQPFVLDGHEIFISASIGLALYPLDGKDLDSLLKNADIAMYHAKEKGRNNYQFFQQSMNVAALERLSLESSLRKALEQNEFILFYQPQMDIRSGNIVGVEALIRWKHPERGMIPPFEFIPLAEETGLIAPIGEWVLNTACRQSKEWQKQGNARLCVSVNISGHQFRMQNISKTVTRALEAADLDPRFLMLEITESTIMQHTEEIMAMFHELTALGVRFSIDDFGTGYSSLSYLKSFPIHELKIDRSFIKDITTNTDTAAIAKAIIAMAHSLKLKVVAEGVETEQQLKLLYDEGCDEMQGYLISRPIPAGEVLKLLAGAEVKALT